MEVDATITGRKHGVEKWRGDRCRIIRCRCFTAKAVSAVRPVTDVCNFRGACKELERTTQPR